MQMFNKLLKSWFFIPIFGITILIYASGCSKILGEVGQEDIQIPSNNAKNLKNLISFVEVIEFINSTKSSAGLSRTNFDSLERLINCKLEIIDSLISDGDGYRYKVVFPSINQKIMTSMKNYDGRVRLGSFFVDLNFNYKELNAKSEIVLDSSSHCFIGEIGGTFTQIFGAVKFERLVTNKVILSFDKLHFLSNNIDNQLSGTLITSWVAGENTDGILNDNMFYFGNGTGFYQNEPYNWKTNLAIEKNMEFGCCANLIKGIIQIEPVNSDKLFKIDFDPFNNKSCDSIVKIYILGKEYEISI